jgi:hypothetical protein
MKLGTFMAVAAVVALIFGLSFILAPVQTMSMYGTTLDIPGQYLGRYLGSAFLGIAVFTWFARNANPKDETLRAVLLGNVVLTITGFVVSLFDKFYGGGNNMAWSTVLIYFLLAVGFGYYRFVKSAN